MFLNSLADFVTRLNLGFRNKADYIYIPYTKLNLQLLWLFMHYGCILFFYIDTDLASNLLRVKVVLKYSSGRSPITSIELVSKPGLRVYWTIGELAQKFSRNNFQGFYILSTPNGLCTSNELIISRNLRQKISGEVLLKIVF